MSLEQLERRLTYIAIFMIIFAVGYGLSLAGSEPIEVSPDRDLKSACLSWENDPIKVENRLQQHNALTGQNAIALTELTTNTIYAHKPETEEDLMILGHEFLHVMWGAWHE
jgi:hypothetical protein